MILSFSPQAPRLQAGVLMKTLEIYKQIHDEVTHIVPFDEIEQNHVDDALAWISSGANIFRIEKPDKPPKHLVSYFIVIDPVHKSLLLGDHIKAQLWLPPGGHVNLHEHPRDTVIREAEEELDVQAKFLYGNERPHFVTVTPTVGLTAGHVDVSLWYLIEGTIHETPWFDRSEFNDINWFTFDEILGSHPAIFDPHMQRFTEKLVKALFPNR